MTYLVHLVNCHRNPQNEFNALCLKLTDQGKGMDAESLDAELREAVKAARLSAQTQGNRIKKIRVHKSLLSQRHKDTEEFKGMMGMSISPTCNSEG